MNDWQAQTVAQAQADIDKTKSIEELEPIGTDILLSSQPWYRQACWPVVVRKRKEFLGEDKPKMLIVDAKKNTAFDRTIKFEGTTLTVKAADR